MYAPIFLWDMEIKGKQCDCDHPGAYRPTSLVVNTLCLGVKVTSLLGAGLQGIRSTTTMGNPRCSGQTTLCCVTIPRGQSRWSKQDLVLYGQELYGGQIQAIKKETQGSGLKLHRCVCVCGAPSLVIIPPGYIGH